MRRTRAGKSGWVAPVQRVFDLVVKPLATPRTPGAFYHGLRLMGIDGTVLDVPDTPANDAHFGRSSGGRGDSAFPQVRKVSLVELGTHIEVAMAVGGYHDSEQKLVEQLWDHLTADALLVEDLDRAAGGFRVLHILPQESSEAVKRDDPRGIEGNRFAVVPLGLIELRLRLIALAQQVFQLGGLGRLIRVRLDCIVQVDQMPPGVVRTLELDGKRGAPPLELAIVRVLPQ